MNIRSFQFHVVNYEFAFTTFSKNSVMKSMQFLSSEWCIDVFTKNLSSESDFFRRWWDKYSVISTPVKTTFLRIELLNSWFDEKTFQWKWIFQFYYAQYDDISDISCDSNLFRSVDFTKNSISFLESTMHCSRSRSEITGILSHAFLTKISWNQWFC